MAGVMVGTSLINGGPGFPLLPACLYQYMVHGRLNVDATSNDVVDFETREVLHKVTDLSLCTKLCTLHIVV